MDGGHRKLQLQMQRLRDCVVSSEHHRRGQTVVEGREQKVCCKMVSLEVTAKTHL